MGWLGKGKQKIFYFWPNFVSFLHSKQQMGFFFCSGGSKAASMASSNTFFNPFYKNVKHLDKNSALEGGVSAS